MRVPRPQFSKVDALESLLAACHGKDLEFAGHHGIPHDFLLVLAVTGASRSAQTCPW